MVDDFGQRLVTALRELLWDTKFSEFVGQLGNFLVAFPDGPREEGTRTSNEDMLAHFVLALRQQFHAHRMSTERVAYIESMIPGWSWDATFDAEFRHVVQSCFGEECSKPALAITEEDCSPLYDACVDVDTVLNWV